MSESIFDRLADALDRLPNGFPRTESKVEIALLRRIFSEDEAALAAQLGRSVESAAEIGERAGLSVKDARTKLMKMVRRGLVWLGKNEGKTGFRLAPFVIGIYEAQLDNLDPEFAQLFERYMADGGAKGVLGTGVPINRVMPAEEAVKPEWVLPYDDVKSVLMKAETFSINDCICRVQRKHVGKECDFPLHMCLSFSPVKRAPKPGDVSREEALALLKKASDIGLVHTVSNSQEVGYVCNCCGCCCTILRGITEWGIENSVAHANYYAVLNEDECVACGACAERCQVNAITHTDDIPEVVLERCIGCGVCVTGCPSGALELVLKDKDDVIEPPIDFAAWEDKRLQARG